MTKAFQIRWDDLHTVSCNNISFLNTRSQLVWVLASSVWQFWRLFETWRMIKISAAYKIYFHTVFTFWKKKTSISRCDILHFFEFILVVFSYNHIKTENLYVNYKKCFGYFTQSSQATLCKQCNPLPQRNNWKRAWEKTWKQLNDVHENSGLNREKKNPRGCVLVAVIQVGLITSHCSGNEPLRKSLQWVPYAQIANDPFANVTFI